MDEKACRTCHGHGYRVQIGPCRTVNAAAAAQLGLKGQKVPCLRCAESRKTEKAA